MAKELPVREMIAVEDTWDLTPIYASKADWEQELSVLEKKVADMQEYKGHLADSAQTLFGCIKLNDEINLLVSRIYNYAQRLYDQDLGNSEHKAMNGKAMMAYASALAGVSFITPEILEIPNNKLETFYIEEKGLELYRHHIEEILRVRAHICSPETEEILARSSEMRETAHEAYSSLTNADMTYPEVVDENGETVRITQGRFVRLLESEDRRVRKETFELFFGVHKGLLNTFASLYAGQVKQLSFETQIRKYESNLEAAVDGNHVPSFVYKNLVDTVNKNLDKMHRYVKLRKKLLGLDELHMYDIYTPMIAGVAQKFTYEEAKRLTIESLAPLGEDYIEVVKEAFRDRWIDVYENQGKRGGAYSCAVYGTHPYMLLNYNGALDEVFTLVHEMGHSMHSYYSNKTQPFVYADYTIFVAEVASTCNEILLLEYLLKNETDNKKRAYLLNHYLDMFKGTLFRQTQFAEFEMRTNEMSEQGETLTGEGLCSLYKEINEKYYGPDMISDDEIAYEWTRIPHFYYDFYVYQYSTSFCASVAIAHDILERGEEAVKGYKEFLSGGCSLPPVELLKKVGIDFETEKPIQDAMDVMAGVLDELERITQ
ncbi:MAG: oligoendopeptidase F [Lachnospiraceae bacterium]|nr:oligoendopeptidase F [Candidatus Merdinaster equi]